MLEPEEHREGARDRIHSGSVYEPCKQRQARSSDNQPYRQFHADFPEVAGAHPASCHREQSAMIQKKCTPIPAIQRKRSSLPTMASNRTSSEKSRLVVASINFSRPEALRSFLRCMKRTITANEMMVPSRALVPSASAGDSGSLQARPQPMPAKTATWTNWSPTKSSHLPRRDSL